MGHSEGGGVRNDAEAYRTIVDRSLVSTPFIGLARDPHMCPGCWPSSATLFGLSMYEIRSDERGLVWDKQRGEKSLILENRT